MSPIADAAACTLTATVSPMPCTPCTTPIIGDNAGYPAVTTTGAPPKQRSAAPLLTLETTVFPVTTGDRTLSSNCATPQRRSGAGTAANARLAARIAG